MLPRSWRSHFGTLGALQPYRAVTDWLVAVVDDPDAEDGEVPRGDHCALALLYAHLGIAGRVAEQTGGFGADQLPDGCLSQITGLRALGDADRCGEFRPHQAGLGNLSVVG